MEELIVASDKWRLTDRVHRLNFARDFRKICRDIHKRTPPCPLIVSASHIIATDLFTKNFRDFNL